MALPKYGGLSSQESQVVPDQPWSQMHLPSTHSPLPETQQSNGADKADCTSGSHLRRGEGRGMLGRGTLEGGPGGGGG